MRYLLSWMRRDWTCLVPGLQCTLPLEVTVWKSAACYLPLTFSETTCGKCKQWLSWLIAWFLGKVSIYACMCTEMHSALGIIKQWVRSLCHWKVFALLVLSAYLFIIVIFALSHIVEFWSLIWRDSFNIIHILCSALSINILILAKLYSGKFGCCTPLKS